MFPMSDAWKRHSWASGLCSLSHPQKCFPDDKIIFLEPGKSTNLHILAFFSYIMTCTPCIFYRFWNVAVTRLLLQFHISWNNRDTACYVNSSGKAFWLHLVYLFPPKNHKPQSKGKSCRLWCGYLSFTNRQQRVDGVSHVMIISFSCPPVRKQSANHCCLSENRSLTVEWKCLMSRCERTDGFASCSVS